MAVNFGVNGYKKSICKEVYAVNDQRGLAPTGWYILSDDEWTILLKYLGGDGVACTKI